MVLVSYLYAALQYQPFGCVFNESPKSAWGKPRIALQYLNAADVGGCVSPRRVFFLPDRLI